MLPEMVGGTDLGGFLRMVMRLAKKHKDGESRFYPLHLLCAYLLSLVPELDEGPAREALSLATIHLSEVRDKHYESLYTHMNILPEHDLHLYVAKLLHP
jgi:hypothetical protein